MTTPNPEATPEQVTPLRAMVDRWAAILSLLGTDVERPDAPSSVQLRSKTGEMLILNAPVRDPGWPDSNPPVSLGTHHYNTVTAQQVIEDVTHTLRVNADAEPFMLSISAGNFADAKTSAEAMMRLCLEGEIQNKT